MCFLTKESIEKEKRETIYMFIINCSNLNLLLKKDKGFWPVPSTSWGANDAHEDGQVYVVN